MKKIIAFFFLVFICIINIHSADKRPYNFLPLRTLFSYPIEETQQLYQDKDGYIWIATTNGLYQYDGYQLKIIKTNYTTPDALSNNNIHCLIEDDEYCIWIGTSNGLNKLNKKTGEITKENTDAFDNNYISSIVITESGLMIVGTDNGLYYFDKNSKRYVLADWIHQSGKLPQTSIQSLYKDSKGYIWIGTWNKGLFRYDDKQNKLYAYKVDDRNSAHTIFEDNKSRLWIGTWGQGLYLLENQYNLDKLKWTNITNNDADRYSIVDNIIYSISEDTTSNTIWIGMRNGLSIINDKGKNDFRIDNYTTYGAKYRIPYNEVNSIIRDSFGAMWIGTLGGGVYTVNTKENLFLSENLLSVKRELSSNSIRSILTDNEGLVWMGIGSRGLVSYNIENQKEIYYGKANPTGYQIRSTINTILQSERDHKLYFGTYREGLFIYDKARGTMQKITPENSNLKSDCVQILKEDKDGNIWIGSRSGVNYIPYGKSIIPVNGVKKGHLDATNYFYLSMEIDNAGNVWMGTDNNGIVKLEQPSIEGNKISCKIYNTDNKGVVSNNIQCLFQDSKGRLWASSESGGLSLFNSKLDRFDLMNERLGIMQDAILNIQEDDSGALWLGTNNGLLKLVIDDKLTAITMRLYTTKDGLASNMFIRNSSFKAKDGKMYFGGHNGFNVFDPSTIKEEKSTSPIVITDIKIYNKSLENIDKETRDNISPLTSNFTKEIRLNHKQNNFSFEFTSLNYQDVSQTGYLYKLENFESEWQYTDATRRYASYNNLKSGIYYFKLKSIDEFGTWQERPFHIRVVILPAPWFTWWAYLIYFTLCVLAIYFVQRSIKNRLKLKEQLKLKELQQARLEEVNHSKLQFFTNITHELLTPLTITSAAVDELKIVEPQYTEYYKVIESNVNRLVRLLQQILEFRKAETGNLKLKVSKGDLALFVKRGVESFQPLMKKKKIHFSIICNPESMPAYFDSDKVDKILYNLLSNASKYNNENGFVQVNLQYDEKKEKAILSVLDNGQGISKEDQKNLFKRFYEGDYRKYKTTGTGIGLSLTKDLVALHNGEIIVESDKDKGACFTVIIPIVKQLYSNDQIDKDYTNIDNEYHEATKEELVVSEEKSITIQRREKTILLIEDNEDLLNLMSRLLSYEYNIIDARNGREGLDIIENEDIDLVVSDVMMPEMNGIEFCKAVKSNFDICHIPVILLTAKTQSEDQVEGYDSGAEGYLSKPFNLSVLHAKIKNLLKAQERKVVDFKKQIVFEAKEFDYTSIDEEFLNRAVECIHEHLDDVEFDQQKFIQVMNVSKSTLYRKLKSLTGLNTSSFIRNIRLKAACQIIEDNKNNIRIAELAYAVGFNDPKYFSASFKKEFGLLPTEYIEQYSQQSSGDIELSD